MAMHTGKITSARFYTGGTWHDLEVTNAVIPPDTDAYGRVEMGPEGYRLSVTFTARFTPDAYRLLLLLAVIYANTYQS